jgi:hypothetical protein
MEKNCRYFMTNEEIIDELLHEADSLKVREEVITLSSKLRDTSPRMTLLESLELALNHLKPQ